MHEIKPVIQLAKERALFRFSALALRMLQDANTSITQLTSLAGSTAEQKTISAAKEWLATQGTVFLKRLYASYFGYVERAMQTMYRDLRQDLQDVPTDTWALIDDETITRQIEVERRVLRLRDADQLSLGRLNLMIAQLHDEHDVRERENPFRPYLMARALHDVLCEMTSTSDVCTMLFDHMSGALATQLPEYFTAIREVFESNGVHARLLARPSSMSRRDREMLAMPQQQNFPGAADAGAAHPSGNCSNGAVTPPALERVLSLLQQRSADMRNVMCTPQQESQAALQDFVWKIFNQTAPDRAPANPRYAHGAAGPVRQDAEDASFKPHPLAAQLHRLQQEVLNREAAQEGAAPLLDLHSALETERFSELERVSLDVVAMLFDFIVGEELIPAAFRTPLARMQVPFLKAVMFAPKILEQGDHPARKLLNRMASAAIGLDAATPPGNRIHAEISLVVENILSDFKVDMAIFSNALQQLDRAVEKILRETDAEAARAIEALEEAEKNPQRHDVLVVQTINALRERLSTINTDPRVVSFIVRVWARVLAHVNEHEGIDKQPYRDVVPDLIWSVQEELDASERNTLMRLLPKLVRQIKDGLHLIGMSDAESRQVLDELVAMHAQVLRMIQGGAVKKTVELAVLHRHFSALRIGAGDVNTADDADAASAIHAPTVPHIRLQAALQKFDVSAHLLLDSDVGTLQNSDIKWLGGMQAGTSVEWWVDNGYLPARLVWINPQQSFYLFQLAAPDGQPRLLVYSSIALIKALREGSIGMAEYAPVFDRAMESLLLNGGNIQQAAAASA